MTNVWQVYIEQGNLMKTMLLLRKVSIPSANIFFLQVPYLLILDE